MDDTALQHQPRFLVSQKLAMTINRYTVTTASQDGAPAQTVAFAEQSRFAMREQVTFYRDETKQARLFTFKARQIVDLGATYDVFSRTGSRLVRSAMMPRVPYCVPPGI